MQLTLVDLVRALTGLVAGGFIGIGFGFLQEAAWRRHKKRQDQGQLESGWVVVPGSMRRVAYLLIALVAIQIVCPLLFVNGTQWWVSTGLLFGYGVMLYRQLRRRGSQGMG